MTEPIELLLFVTHRLWTFAGEIAPEAFIGDHLRRRGMSSREAGAWMRKRQPRHVRELPVPVVALRFGARTLGYRVRTTVGERCATSIATKAFLRREGYTPDEVHSLFMLATRERVPHPESVRRDIARGIAV
ncbi:MAG TPA: hypothetical protein VGN57_23550 [Pirellulaceae bacterium]|jgi:hypothetical protein|nr:hypothetical protein [Pirellulaceae bacterium]